MVPRIQETAGNPNWAVLIHGLGVSEKVWFSPLEEKILFISFKTLLGKEKDIIPFAERCKGICNVASWTQDLCSTVDDAAYELKTIVEYLGTLGSQRVVLVAHSRGGIVARRAIQKYGLNPNGLICLATPHWGSGLADLTISHFRILRCLVPYLSRLEPSIRELCKAGNLIREINGADKLAAESHVAHYDISGDSTNYFDVGFSVGGLQVSLFNVMTSLERITGRRIIEEWRNTWGDGFVAAASAKSPMTPDHAYFRLPVNHANILIDNRAWGIVNSILCHCFGVQPGAA